MYVRMGVRMSRTHLLAAPTTAATVAIAAAEHAWVLFYDAVDILLQLLDALHALKDFAALAGRQVVVPVCARSHSPPRARAPWGVSEAAAEMAVVALVARPARARWSIGDAVVLCI